MAIGISNQLTNKTRLITNYFVNEVKYDYYLLFVHLI